MIQSYPQIQTIEIYQRYYIVSMVSSAYFQSSIIHVHFLQVAVDPKQFLGLNSVADAVEYLHSGKSVGKVLLHLFYFSCNMIIILVQLPPRWQFSYNRIKKFTRLLFASIQSSVRKWRNYDEIMSSYITGRFSLFLGYINACLERLVDTNKVFSYRPANQKIKEYTVLAIEHFPS